MSLSINKHIIKPKNKVYRNISINRLIKKALKNKEVVQAKNGTIIVYTGKYTGRSPKDKFIVDTPKVHEYINWNDTNVPIDINSYQKLYKKITKYLSNREEVYVFDGFAGAHENHKLHVRVISEYAYQALFINHLLRRPTKKDLKTHNPQLTIICAPGCIADPEKDNTNSETFIVMNLEENVVLIGGTKYAGEIKKAIFSVLNYHLPFKKIFPMHCSANTNHKGETALFFGLSGTGKTTLSADPKRKLIGDDEHGWSEDGIFNFEGGCYAKCINLKKESEPQIWNAIKSGTLLENVTLNDQGEFDFADDSLTENTRAAYPLEYIDNSILSGVGDHPQKIIFLTADAFGVLPPVAKLNLHSSLYHFISGYTSKLAGTERGIKKPQATFSAFFGGPFMPQKPMVYAELLKYYVQKFRSTVYLVNTGWMGGPYGIGKRISIQHTREIITQLLDGKLDNVQYRHDGLFNLDVPQNIDNIDTGILIPKSLWDNKSEYDLQAKKLANLFIENMKKYNDISEDIIKGGPTL